MRSSAALRGSRAILVLRHKCSRVAGPHLARARALRSCVRVPARIAGSTIWSFETPHVVFLLAAGPDHVGRVEKAADALRERGCVPGLFTRVQAVPVDDVIHSSLLNDGLSGG
jgi:hypothetical protein